MQLRLQKSRLPILLALMALLVWGHNGYRFFKGVQADDDVNALRLPQPINSSVTKTTVAQKSDNWVYEPKFRDPFKDWLRNESPPKERQPPTRPRRTPPSKPVLPRLRFIGIVMDETGSLAILEDRNQEIHFAEVGDTVTGVKIVSIDSSQVACQFKKKRFTLNLKN